MKIEMIPVRDMRIDSSYQRAPDSKRVEKIAANWDDLKANLIHVSHREDGHYYVMDGNHTRLAYLKNGGDKLPCRVHEGLTVDDEARLFYELNLSQKKPSFGEILKAKAAAGCELEKTYLQALSDAGIDYTFTNSRGCKIKCHAALIHIYKTTTYETMLRALRVAKEAADERETFFQVGYFPGLCALVVSHPDIDDQRLIRVIQNTTSSRVKEIADSYRKSAVSGSTSTTRDFKKTYIHIYNKGLRKNKIMED